MTLPLSKEHIAAIQARAEKATPGPWVYRDAPYGFDVLVLDKATERALWIAPVHGPAFKDSPYYPPREQVFSNVELIANARTDIPALCQQALRAIELESELAAARNALEEERERCAKVALEYGAEAISPIAARAAEYIATEIRREVPSPQVKP